MEYAKSFRANGKLLFTGEYIVLEGAKALSFPTKLGQELRVSFVPQSQFVLQWQSFDHENNLWFEAIFDNQLLAQEDDSPVAANLSKLLQIAFENNPLAIGRYHVSTHLAFPREWGLGSSSSLIALISKWSGCDPYKLFYNTQNGSGYDVASALCDAPILFQRNGLSPVVQPVIWQPAFRDQLAFVYRGAKQNSTQEVTRFVRNTAEKILPVSEVTTISEALLTCDEIEGFEQLVYEHERLLSELLAQPPVKAQLFPDYQGLIKSLGAWGGDFMLITKRDGYKTYFERKGLSLILDWEELLLNAP